MSVWSQFFGKNKEDLSAQIIRNKKEGRIYVADFENGVGKYISATYDAQNDGDIVLKISSRIDVRLTFILEKEAVKGLTITKVYGKRIDSVSLSTVDGKKLLAILELFSKVDLGSVSQGSLILDKNIVSDPEELERLLNTVAADEYGKVKLSEVCRNFNLLAPGAIDEMVQRRASVEEFEKLLESDNFFNARKTELAVGKDEEVWERFFQDNSWFFGTDSLVCCRNLSDHEIMDLPLRGLDGFLDIVELKLPTADFWKQADDISIPRAGVMAAIMQCARYINVAEHKQNDKMKLDELQCDILKPKATLVYGRSSNWTKEQWAQFRILNSMFHNIAILTYDMILQRAKKMLTEPSGR